MNRTSFRKRGERRVTVFSGNRIPNIAEREQRQRLQTLPSSIERIHKGMSVSEVEFLLGHGNTDPMQAPGRFAIVKYRDSRDGVVVVYKDHHVVSVTSA